MHKQHPNLAFASLAEQEAHQSSALGTTLQYVNEASPFYKRLFRDHNVNVNKIHSLSDLGFLPTTTKSDIQSHNWEFLCVSDKKIREYTATSGTLGNPVTIPLTANDLARLAYNEQQSFTCAGAHSGDIYQLLLTLDRQFMAGMAYYLGLQLLGVAVIRSGPGVPGVQFELLERLQANGIVGVPSFLLKMAQYACENGISLSKMPVSKAVCIGENIRQPDFELNSLGRALNNEWPIKLYSTYASTEMQTAFTECEHGNGTHHQPDLIIMEVLNDHGDSLKEGEYGELTITTLGVEGMPLVRYRTGDICAWYYSACACGRRSKRLSPIAGRKQQMLKYKGTTLYPPAIFEILNNVHFIVEYVVEAYTSPEETDEITLHLHTSILQNEAIYLLKPILNGSLRVVPEIKFHSQEGIQRLQFPEGSRKQVRFIDRRTNKL